MSSNYNLEDIRKELEELKKKKTSEGGVKITNLLSKYFTPRADTEVFRIIKSESNNKKPIQEAYFHEVELNTPSGKKAKGRKVYCLARNEAFVPKKDAEGNIIYDQENKPVMVPKRCPFCEKQKELLKKQDQSIRGKKRDDLSPEKQVIFDRNKEIFKEANKWAARKFYIVKGIDKGNTKDGVKFWRFKENFKNQGVFDKLYPVLNQFMEDNQVPYYDIEKGADLIITMADASLPNGVKYKSVSSIIARKSSKLHEDPIIAKQWVEDKITWRDVFKPKTAPNITPEKFMELTIEGNDPYWDDSDQNNKKWVFPNHPDLEKKANQRNNDLTANPNAYDNYQQASDVDNSVNIDNITKNDVGDFNENKKTPNAVDPVSDFKDDDGDKEETNQNQNDYNTNDTNDSDDDYDMDEDIDDLPF